MIIFRAVLTTLRVIKVRHQRNDIPEQSDDANRAEGPSSCLHEYAVGIRCDFVAL